MTLKPASAPSFVYYSVKTWTPVVTLMNSSWGGVGISCETADGGAHQIGLYFFEGDDTSSPFIGTAEGSDILNYTIYLETYGSRELFSGMLGLLSLPGPQLFVAQYDIELPPVGNISANILFAQFEPDNSVSTGFARGEALQRYPERLRKRLSPRSGAPLAQ
jgi:hypothetical protein